MRILGENFKQILPQVLTALAGSTYDGIWDSWYGPSGHDGHYNVSEVTSSYAGQALKGIGKSATADEIAKLRDRAQVRCANSTQEKISCRPLQAACLFNIEEDPCEERNLANEYPEILEEMEVTLKEWNASAVAPANLPLDPKGNPEYWDYTWTNFGDYPPENSVYML